MIKLDRLCIPIGLGCNINCLYCCRQYHHICKQTYISDDVIKYIQSNNYNTICLTGGEPLLDLDRLKYIFSLCPTNVHKKVITNGTLIDKSFVKYVNANNIEVNISHDGMNTDILRTVDILKCPNILNNIRNINNLYFTSTITNMNSNIVSNYLYIKRYLKDTAFVYVFGAATLPNGHYLTNDFDYDEYRSSLYDFSIKYGEYLYWYNNKLDKLNVDLSGNVVSNFSQYIYGNIHDDITTVLSNKFNSREVSEHCLNNKSCTSERMCYIDNSIATEFTCRLHNINLEIKNQLNNRSRHDQRSISTFK